MRARFADIDAALLAAEKLRELVPRAARLRLVLPTGTRALVPAATPWATLLAASSLCGVGGAGLALALGHRWPYVVAGLGAGALGAVLFGLWLGGARWIVTEAASAEEQEAAGPGALLAYEGDGADERTRVAMARTLAEHGGVTLP